MFSCFYTRILHHKTLSEGLSIDSNYPLLKTHCIDWFAKWLRYGGSYGCQHSCFTLRVDLLRGKTLGEILFNVHSTNRELYWYLAINESKWLGILSNNHHHGESLVGKCLPSIWGSECSVIQVHLSTRNLFHVHKCLCSNQYGNGILRFYN